MARKIISSNSEYEDKIGYSRAMVEGDTVYVSGTTGFNYSTMSISDNVIEQAEQCFNNIGLLDDAMKLEVEITAKLTPKHTD